MITKKILLGTYYYSGIGVLFNVGLGRRRGIISFHNVLDEVLLKEPYLYRNAVSTQIFEKQIQYLTDHWTVQPAAKINDPDVEGLFITFDDGMQNNYTTVLPILERYGLTALFAVCPGLVVGKIPHIWQHHIYLILKQAVDEAVLLPMDGYVQPIAVTAHNIDPLVMAFSDWVDRKQLVNVYGAIQEICERNNLQYARLDYLPDMFHSMTWEMIADLCARGHVIASHTWSHRILRLLPMQEKKWELEISKATLETHLGRAVENIVYPYGTSQTVDGETLSLARRVGYRLGFLNVPFKLFEPAGMNIGRFGLPSSFFRPDLHATISGIKHLLFERAA
jgi:peptidoglycan/xylan/chitin deacetylase (PgdA/CDA1 family)